MSSMSMQVVQVGKASPTQSTVTVRSCRIFPGPAKQRHLSIDSDCAHEEPATQVPAVKRFQGPELLASSNPKYFK
eukprot:1001253-Rhodomonas_salina.6